MVMEKVDRTSFLFSNLHSGSTLPGQDVKTQACFGEERGFRANDEPVLLSTLGCVYRVLGDPKLFGWEFGFNLVIQGMAGNAGFLKPGDCFGG